jgi:hypothetical protein
MADDDDDFAAESSDPTAKREGPPDDWQKQSWFDFKAGEWWYRFPVRGGEGVWRRDPPPVVPLGFVKGEYIFVTKARELRHFTSGQLHGRGGFADLFAGDKRWPVRHYPATDREGNPTGRPNVPELMEALIRQCTDYCRYYDGAIPHRSIGTWRGPEGRPLVHAGDRIFHRGEIHPPGDAIGDARYVLGADRQAPAYVNVGRDQYEWQPSGLDGCARLLGHLEEWHWSDQEALELFAGWLWCAMLGDAPRWKPHAFIRADRRLGQDDLAALRVGAAGRRRASDRSAPSRRRASRSASPTPPARCCSRRPRAIPAARPSA